MKPISKVKRLFAALLLICSITLGAKGAEDKTPPKPIDPLEFSRDPNVERLLINKKAAEKGVVFICRPSIGAPWTISIYEQNQGLLTIEITETKLKLGASKLEDWELIKINKVEVKEEHLHEFLALVRDLARGTRYYEKPKAAVLDGSEIQMLVRENASESYAGEISNATAYGTILDKSCALMGELTDKGESFSPEFAEKLRKITSAWKALGKK